MEPSSTPGLCRTHQELRDWTGLDQKAAIARWLRTHQHPFDPDAVDGWPRVLRSYLFAKLGAPQTPTRPEPRLRLVPEAKR